MNNDETLPTTRNGLIAILGQGNNPQIRERVIKYLDENSVYTFIYLNSLHDESLFEHYLYEMNLKRRINEAITPESAANRMIKMAGLLEHSNK